MPQHNPRWVPTERLDQAFALARRMHGTQSRKVADGEQGAPYISHLMAVSALIMENDGTEEQAIAGLLHDLVEDTKTTIAEVEARFGAGVARIVRDCTDGESAEKETFETPEEKLADWKKRKEAYLEALRKKEPDDPSLLVALADKVHNAIMTEKDLRGLTAEKRTVYFEKFTAGEVDQRWWYTGLAEAFLAKPTAELSPLAVQLDDLVRRMFP